MPDRPANAPGSPESTPVSPQATPAAEAEAAQPHRLEAQRRAKREQAEALGVAPYGGRTEGLISIEQARRMFDAAADEEQKAKGKEPGFIDRRPVVKVAGRVVLHRDTGKLVFMQVRDHTSAPARAHGEEHAPGPAAEVADLQIAVSQRDCDEAGFGLAKVVDLGDVIVAEGPLTTTRTGEVTVWASSVRMAAKSLAPPPEKWSGLQDTEIRYRRRYVDLYANPETMRVAKMRSRVVARMRRFLDEREFLEVETPMLQPQAGGAAARPFVTHLNALDMQVFMRIAPELYLKRLLVGGLPRVYEINRNFRNEGVDRSHNPEFTMLEVYEAFGNYHTMMALAEEMIREVAHYVAVSAAPHEVEAEDIDPRKVKLPFGDLMIDYGSPFARITFAELFERGLGFPMRDVKQAREEAKRRHMKHEGVADIFVINQLFEDVAEKALDPAKPTFIMDYPAALSPLTRPKKDDPATAERWDLFIAHMEIGPAYTELNDPDVQAEKFREQLQGVDEEESTFRTFDADFIEALKVGMPPAGGMGIGIDRVVMLMTNQRSIRDVILFPFMRRE